MLSDEEHAIDQDDWTPPSRPTVACSPPDYFGLSGWPGEMIEFIPVEDPRVQQLRDACDV